MILIFHLILLATLINTRVDGASLENQIDCLPDNPARDVNAQKTCEDRGCVWEAPPDSDTWLKPPWCFYPPNTGYVASYSNDSDVVMLTKYPQSLKSPFGKDIDQLKLEQSSIGATLNVRIGYDGSYEPPVYIPRRPSQSSEHLKLVEGGQMSKINDKVYSFSITRGSTRSRIWDTSIGGMVFADQFIQIATLLPSYKIYGFSDNIHYGLKHTTYEIVLSTKPPPPELGRNLYGVHPFYIGLESDRKAYGVLILNSNAQEVTPGYDYFLVYRTIGGMLDLYFFPGPRPEDVVRQYQMLIGTPFLPAYWALGFQLSGYGYKKLSDLQFALNRTIENKIPIDVVHADIDYMDRFQDFTIGEAWSGLGDYAKELHKNNIKLITILDPAIQADSDAYKRAVDKKVSFIEWPTEDLVQNEINDNYTLTRGKKTMLGVVWPDRHVGFPDFLDPLENTTTWWRDEIVDFHSMANFDGIWLDMNEPGNFGTNEEPPWYWPDKKLIPLKCPLSGNASHYDMPPYQTINVYQWPEGSVLASKTLCMLATTSRNTSRFYDTKNLYGLAESIATQKAVYDATKQRGVVISRSTFPSSGHYAGHWLGDNQGKWEDLRSSVIAVQEFNLFGIPYVGSDICGNFPGVTEKLCLRWQQLGAFQSFSRNHNSANNAGRWPSVVNATRQANLFRYRYLPYLYSTHFEASLHGGTVIRPMYFEFPLDVDTHDLGEQFMWGPAIMAAPALSENHDYVNAYLPTNGTWYSLREKDYGQLIPTGFETISATIDELPPVFMRGGAIIPRQKPEMTTTASRRNPFEIVAALGTEGSEARGELYWDDGLSIVADNDFSKHAYNHFTFSLSHVNVIGSYTVLNISATRLSATEKMPTLDVIEIFGYDATPGFPSFEMRIDNVLVTTPADQSQWSCDARRKLLRMETNNFIELNKNSVQLKWIIVKPTPPTTTVLTTSTTTTTSSTTTTTKFSSTQAPVTIETTSTTTFSSTEAPVTTTPQPTTTSSAGISAASLFGCFGAILTTLLIHQDVV